MKQIGLAAVTAAMVFALVVSVPAGPAYGFSIELSPYGDVVRWPSNVSNITYYVNPNARGMSSSAVISTIKSCFNDWEAVSCSYLGFSFGGTTSTMNLLPLSNRGDDYNELAWAGSGTWSFGQYVLGVTVPLFGYDGKITESDIAFNNAYYEWNNYGGSGIGYQTMDLKSVAIHEIGHFFGLQHVLDYQNYPDYPTMAPAVSPNGDSASLSQDDKYGICFLYPSSGNWSCSSDSMCPYIVDRDNNGQEYYSGRYRCYNGRCTRTNLTFGDLCETSNQCASSYTCMKVTDSIKMCDKRCSRDSDCGNNYYCKDMGTSGRWCVPGVPPARKRKNGQACSNPNECLSSYCSNDPNGKTRTCRRMCKADDPQGCASNEDCYVSPGAWNTGGCYPLNELPKFNDGAYCVKDGRCKSNFCYKGRCASRCTTDAQCNPGFHCENRQACVPGAPKPKGSLGASCSSGADCASGLCYPATGNKPVCTQVCTNDSQCKQHYKCSKIPSGYNVSGACILHRINERCNEQADCMPKLTCLPNIDTGVKYCRSTCNFQDWKCPAGTSCIEYWNYNLYGICMPNQGKHATGQPCHSTNDCVSRICYQPAGKSVGYCTQNCRNRWCPGSVNPYTGKTQQMSCKELGGQWGDICIFAAPKPPPQNNTDNGGNQNPDTGGVQTPVDNGNNGGGGGCTTAFGSSGIAPLGLLLLGLALLRSRKNF